MVLLKTADSSHGAVDGQGRRWTGRPRRTGALGVVAAQLVGNVRSASRECRCHGVKEVCRLHRSPQRRWRTGIRESKRREKPSGARRIAALVPSRPKNAQQNTLKPAVRPIMGSMCALHTCPLLQTRRAASYVHSFASPTARAKGLRLGACGASANASRVRSGDERAPPGPSSSSPPPSNRQCPPEDDGAQCVMGRR